jgi:hypothetical protein
MLDPGPNPIPEPSATGSGSGTGMHYCTGSVYAKAKVAVPVPVPVPQHWRVGSGNKLDVSQVLAGQEKASLLGLDQTVDVSSLKFYYAEDDGGFPLGMTSERMPTCCVEFSLHFGKLFLYLYFFGGLECVGHSFAYVQGFGSALIKCWIRIRIRIQHFF